MCKNKEELTKVYEINMFRHFTDEQKAILKNYKFPKYEYYAHPENNEYLIVEPKGKKCECCGELKQVLFDCSGTYGSHRNDDLYVCPECLSSGLAGDKLDIISGLVYDFSYQTYIKYDKITDPEKIRQVEKCTPPILTANDMEFRTHCNDFAEYIGEVYYQDIKNLGKQGIKDIKEDLKLNKKEFMLKFRELKECNPDNEDMCLFVHLFRCKHCGKYLVQVDLD